MSAQLDHVLAETFRRAHWPEEGTPLCPTCYDGRDVMAEGARGRVNRALRTYRCRCCDRRKFSDTSGTPLANTNAPLRVWAYVLLEPEPRISTYRAERLLGVRHHRIAVMRQKLAESALAARWREELTKAGVTVAVIASAAKQSRPRSPRGVAPRDDKHKAVKA